MEKIYSKIEPEKLLHIIIRFEDIIEERMNISADNEFLQIATMHLPEGKTFKPHKHLWKDGEKRSIAQESWVILAGVVKAIYYDLDGTKLVDQVLHEGDCSITFYGGHNYVAIKPSKVLEYKTGPYHGQELDKEMIKE